MSLIYGKDPVDKALKAAFGQQIKNTADKVKNAVNKKIVDVAIQSDPCSSVTNKHSKKKK